MSDLYDRGLEIRKAVLGDGYVESALANATEFDDAMQKLTTEYCWGWTWGREPLPRRTRSLLNLAMLSALNRAHEFKVHVRGALRNGVTKDEIRETLLQVAIYCGIPAGVEAFRLAKESIAEHEAAP